MLKQIVFDLKLDHKDFYRFAYTLREYDTQDVETRRLLDQRLKPDVLVDIIASNQYDDGVCTPRDDSMFYIYID